MNKIVCDLCGTSYPETAPQCPICGTAKSSGAKSTSGSETGYAYVKGGRFSHANVRKRNAGNKELPRVVAPVKPQKPAPQPKAPKEPKQPKAATAPVSAAQQPAPRRQAAAKQPPKDKGRGTNILLAIIALLLVLAIIAVFAYLVKGFIDDRKPTEPTGTTNGPTVPTELEIPCRGIRLSMDAKTFGPSSHSFHLSSGVILDPQDTTDTVWYESSDERIAIVDENGIVYPVADGVAIVTVHCGQFSAECTITVQIGKSPENPTEPTDPTDPTEPTDPVELVLNRTEFTLTGFGDYWDLYTAGELDPAEITWSSSDETVAKVENGRVTAVGNGTAIITAEYMGQVVTCSVRCTKVEITNYELQTRYGTAKDFTLKVGSTITLFMVDKETGLRVPAEELLFALSKEGIITIDANGKITAVASGTVTVTVTYGDISLKCKVRVTKS